MVLNYYALAKFPTNNFTFRKVLHHEGISPESVAPLLQTCIRKKIPFSSLSRDTIKTVLNKAYAVRDTLDSKLSADDKVKALAKEITLINTELLQKDLEKERIDEESVHTIEHEDAEAAELEETEIKQMSAVELMTIVGSKGLSADHVIIIGFDDVNMKWVTRNAFFVAMSRTRRSLHLITALGAGGAKEPHKFLTRLPDANLEYCKYTKAKGREKLRGRINFGEYIKSLNAARNSWRNR
jgi:superfamily I DNA/RNA helicase